MASAGRFGSSPVKGDDVVPYRDDSRGRGISKIGLRVPGKNDAPFQNRYNNGTTTKFIQLSDGNMYQLHYFDTMGRGECIRMLLKHA